MEDYQLRLIEERDALQSKFNALEIFMASELFNSEEFDRNKRHLLELQFNVMRQYLEILQERIVCENIL